MLLTKAASGSKLARKVDRLPGGVSKLNAEDSKDGHKKAEENQDPEESKGAPAHADFVVRERETHRLSQSTHSVVILWPYEGAAKANEGASPAEGAKLDRRACSDCVFTRAERVASQFRRGHS